MKKNIGIIALGLALALVGCKQNNQIEPTADGAELIINGKVGAITKYNGGTTFEVGDQISLYATGKGVALKNTGNHIDNAQYEREAVNFVNKAGSNHFPASGGLDIYAFYPYDASGIDSECKYTFTAKVDQSAGMNSSDFLLAKQSVAPSLQPVTLNFGHAMAKLKVTAVAGDDHKDGTKVESVVMLKAANKAIINISTAISKAEGAAVEIKPSVSVDPDKADKHIGQAIVAPQVITKNNVFAKIKMTNGKEYDIVLPTTDLTLEQGKYATVDVVVPFGGNKPIILSATITDWVDVELAKDVEIIEQLKAAFNGTCTLPAMPAYDKAFVTFNYGGETKKTTLEVAVTRDVTKKEIYFEFRGANNVPVKTPYTITRIGLKEGANAVTEFAVNNGAIASEGVAKSFSFDGSAITFN